MKKRKTLETLFHIDPQSAQVEYDKRFESENTIIFPLKIGQWQSFAVSTPETGTLISSILRNNGKIQALQERMPEVRMLSENYMLDEIRMSNDIEGVYSSRKILKSIWNGSLEAGGRFHGLVRSYTEMLSSDRSEVAASTSDIRHQYDKLLLEDIRAENPENLPDGIRFRAQPVSVWSARGEIHRGVHPEKNIEKLLTEGLDYVVNGTDEILIRIAFFHFLFGYVHPFYDGNGRLNRYLSMQFLSSELELTGILHLSLMIRQNRREYYKEFEDAEKELNRGELTGFINYFLRMVDDSIRLSLDTAREKSSFYLRIVEWIETNIRGSDKASARSRKLLRILAADAVFSWRGRKKSELAVLAECHENTISSFISKYRNLIYEEMDSKYKRYMLNLDAEEFRNSV